MKKINLEKMLMIEGGKELQVNGTLCFVAGLSRGLGILLSSGFSLLAPDPVWKACIAS